MGELEDCEGEALPVEETGVGELRKVRLWEVDEAELTLRLLPVELALKALELLLADETDEVRDAEAPEVELPEADEVLDEETEDEVGLLEMEKDGLWA